MSTNKTISGLNGLFKEVYADALEDFFLSDEQMLNRREYITQYSKDLYEKLSSQDKKIILNKGVVFWEKSQSFKKDLRKMLD